MIKTKRLIVRQFAATDAADLFEYLSNPAIYKFEPGDPISIDRAMLMSQERSASTDFLALELLGSGKMIGNVYFKQIEPGDFRTWELGYIVNPAYQGKGYATEAISALLRKEFKEKPIHRVVAHCNPENDASWKLLERVGLLRKNVFFRRAADSAEIWTDTYEYAILETEAEESLGKAEA